jgi:hypothetical protein
MFFLPSWQIGRRIQFEIRPITILSCLGKLFTAILNERLQVFSDDFFC